MTSTVAMQPLLKFSFGKSSGCPVASATSWQARA